MAVADSFPVFREAKIVHLLCCGHDPVSVEPDRQGGLILHFPLEANADAREYERTRAAYTRVAYVRGHVPTPDEILRALAEVEGKAK